MSASAGRMGPRPRLRVLTGGDETSASPSRRMGPEGAGGGLGRRFVSTALATAGAWLVEPAEVSDPAPDAVRGP